MGAALIKDAQCDIFCRCIMTAKNCDILNKSWIISRKALLFVFANLSNT